MTKTFRNIALSYFLKNFGYLLEFFIFGGCFAFRNFLLSGRWRGKYDFEFVTWQSLEPPTPLVTIRNISFNPLPLSRYIIYERRINLFLFKIKVPSPDPRNGNKVETLSSGFHPSCWRSRRIYENWSSGWKSRIPWTGSYWRALGLFFTHFDTFLNGRKLCKGCTINNQFHHLHTFSPKLVKPKWSVCFRLTSTINL